MIMFSQSAIIQVGETDRIIVRTNWLQFWTRTRANRLVPVVKLAERGWYDTKL